MIKILLLFFVTLCLLPNINKSFAFKLQASVPPENNNVDNIPRNVSAVKNTSDGHHRTDSIHVNKDNVDQTSKEAIGAQVMN
uniref:Uncharacterized protein n=1 Tax=Parastrongyloides trichosuri TaxID=131310 RepID=A0A0N4ZDL0_PARTI